ncbi:butyrate kinase [Elusimicrobium posterum]|uniref:butyrate kinase n=1 Tax=Elusimicrobium posterum TaxID=3116653 RepID=UPI003C72EACF
MQYNILVINPGSTSEDIGYYRGENAVFEETLRYAPAELDKMTTLPLSQQKPLRKDSILKKLKDHNVDLAEIDAVIGRGGKLRPMTGGVYTVNDLMVEDLKNPEIVGTHPCNLGGILALEIAGLTKHAKSFIADPVVVDEFEPLARYTGIPEIERKSVFHALNQKRVARKAAKELNRLYEESNFIVVHAGGGITVGAHKNGRVVDVNNGYDGTGPITPQRAGTLPASDFLSMCFSGKYTKEELSFKLHGKGGIFAYTGISDIKVLLEYAQNGVQPKDSKIKVSKEKAQELIDAMIYTVSKEIGSMAVVLKGKIDAVVLTGGLAHSDYFTQRVKEYTSFLTDRFFIFKGGDEKAALRESAQAALEHPEIIKIYK